jgi:hypothetical protein
MSFRTASNLVLITCLSVSGSGCSFAFVNGPPSGHENLEDFGCTESKVVPAVDGAWAGLWGVLAVVAMAQDHNSESEQLGQGLTALVGAGVLVLNGASSITGFTRVNSCRAARSQLARRAREAAERARLMARGDPPSGDSTPTRIP